MHIKILLKSTAKEAVEYIGVEISGHDNTKCVLICVYNPSRLNDLSCLFAKLAQISLQYEKIIVCGDFNINLLNNDPKARLFIDNIASCGLLVVNNLPTRYGINCSPALLDLVLCSNTSLSIHFDQISLGGISDHDMLVYVCDFNLHEVLQKETVFYDFKSINIEMLYYECSLIDWNSIWLLPDVNSKLELFNEIITHLFDKFVPKKIIKQFNSKPFWYNSLVKDYTKKRNKLYVA